MRNRYDKDNWPGRTAARQFVLWAILWLLIELVLITWIFYAYGEEANFIRDIVQNELHSIAGS